MLVEPSDLARRGRDRALIEAHCAGDQTAFPVIVHDHYRTLLAQAHRRLGTRVEAEDAVQETFERAYRGLCRVSGEYRIGAWLRRILANVCTDHAARREVQRALPERIGPRHTTAPDASEHASDPVVLRAVQAALDALPAAQRQTFWLYEMDGLSYPEVAEQLGISEDNARARVHRAKATLRRTLARARDAVAAIIAIPSGLRVLSRHGKPLAAPVPNGASVGPPVGSAGELAQSVPASASGLQAGVAHVAYTVTTGPVAEFATSTASGGGRTIMLIAVSVATAVGGLVAAPAVTVSSGSSSAPASVSVAAANDDSARVVDAPPSVTASVVAETVDTGPSTPPTATPASAPEVDWISAAMDAGDDAPRASVGASGPGPSARTGVAPAVDPCPWLKSYPDVLAALPGRAPVIGTLDPAKSTTGSGGVSLALSSATTLRIADQAGGPTTTEVPVSLRAQVCLEPGESAIVADLQGADGQRVQLRGALVMRLNDQVFLFRGSVFPAGPPTSSLPWGLADRFVAQLELSPTTHTASLDVAFLGVPGAQLPATTPTTSPEPPNTTPSTTTPTTLPTTTTTLPTTSTTLPPPTPTTTLPGGSPTPGSPP